MWPEIKHSYWLPLFSQCSCMVPYINAISNSTRTRVSVTQLGLYVNFPQFPGLRLHTGLPVLGWNMGTKRPRNETTKERIAQGTKRPRNETSKIYVSFLGTKRLGNEKSSHPFRQWRSCVIHLIFQLCCGF